MSLAKPRPRAAQNTQGQATGLSRPPGPLPVRLLPGPETSCRSVSFCFGAQWGLGRGGGGSNSFAPSWGRDLTA